MDWNDLRFFLAVVRTNSLVGAAKELHVTQSTVGRRIAALEDQLGVRLLHRTEQGYLPTPAGDAIREHVERVEAETFAVERAVGGMDTRLAGTVRIAGPELLASHILAPCAAALYTRYPEITLELVANSTAPDLARREADISVQLSRCEEGRLVVRRIGTMAFGLYASVSYLSRHGDPDPSLACAGHFLATMVAERELPVHAEWLTEVAGRAHVLLRTNSREVLFWSALQAGGLALLPCFRGDYEPAMRRIKTIASAPAIDVWLVVHEEVRQVPRVRAVIDCLAETFRHTAEVSNQGAESP